MKMEFKPYTAPAGGWGSVGSLARRLPREGDPVSAGLTLMQQNKPDGFACVSCAWAKPADPHPVRVLRERRQGDRLGADAAARARRSSSPRTR